MKVLRIIGTVLLSILLFGLLMAYPYTKSIGDIITDKEVVSELFVSSDVDKEIKKALEEAKEDALTQVEENVRKELESSDKKYSSKEINKRVKQTKEEIEKFYDAFNTEENIEAIITKVIDILYTNDEFNVKEILNEEVDRIIKDNKLKISDRTKKEIDRFVDELATDMSIQYTDSNDENQIVAYVNPLPSLELALKGVSTGMLVGCIVIAVIIALINIKHIVSTCVGLSVPSLIAGVLCLVSSSVLKTAFDSITGVNLSILNVIGTLAKGVAGSIRSISFIYLVIGLVLLILAIIIKSVQKSKN